jgi:hypothetical protein
VFAAFQLDELVRGASVSANDVIADGASSLANYSIGISRVVLAEGSSPDCEQELFL